MASNYDIDYKDSRFTEVETDKKAALSEVEKTYGDMISQSNEEYDKLIQGAEGWGEKQTQIQNEQTDFAIEQIEQQKDQSKKDYTKEQSGAYVDWQKQSNQYGENAERQAAVGMANTGFSESSQVAMYNAYQNRVATARASFDLATQNYNNQITEARLQNNSALASIAYQVYEKQAAYALQKMQNQNTLLLEQANKKLQVDEMYYQRWKDVLAQMNTENTLAEQIRQYNENLNLDEKKLAEQIRQYNKSYVLDEKKLAETIRQYNESLQLDEKKLEETIRHNNASLAEDKRQFDKSYLLNLIKALQSTGTQSPGTIFGGTILKGVEYAQSFDDVKYLYDQAKSEKFTQKELDAILKKALELGILKNQRQADEIRNGR